MYEEALALGLADEERPRAMFRRGVALNVLGDPDRVSVLEEARALFETAGDDEAAAEASSTLAEALWYSGRTEEHKAALSRAEELSRGTKSVFPLPGSARRRRVRDARQCGRRRDSGRPRGARHGRAARFEELRANVLSTIGTAMSNSEPGTATRWFGRRRHRDALNSVEAPAPSTISPCPRSSKAASAARHELLLESRTTAERVGSDNYVRFAEGNLCWTSYAIGDWNDSLRRCDAFIAECEAGSAHASEAFRRTRALRSSSDATISMGAAGVVADAELSKAKRWPRGRPRSAPPARCSTRSAGTRKRGQHS